MKTFSFFLFFLLLFLTAFSISSAEAKEAVLKIDIVALKEDPEMIELREKRINQIKEEREEIYNNIAELEALKVDYNAQIKENEIKIDHYIKELAFIKSQADINKTENYYLNSNTKFEIVSFELESGKKVNLIKYHVRKYDTLKSIAERTYELGKEQNHEDLEKRIASILQINNLFNIKNNLENIEIVYIPFFR